MAVIDYYFSVASPFVCLAGLRLEQIAARHGAKIRYLPVDAAQLFARTGGQALPDRHESRRSYRLQDLRRQAAKQGLALQAQPQFWPVNAAPAAYAIISAADSGQGDVGALVQGLARACWVEDRNIADEAVIRDVLTASGFDPDLAGRGMFQAAETYGVNLEEAVRRGVFGVPFYLVGDERFWGQDRLEDLDLWLAGKL